MEKLEIFIGRLSKIGITVELFANYPWIYIDTVNGRRVTEKYQSDHKFTVAFTHPKMEFTDLGEIFKLVRKYAEA